MPTERFSLQVDVDTRKADAGLAKAGKTAAGTTTAFGRLDARVRSLNTSFLAIGAATALFAGLNKAKNLAIQQAQAEGQLEQAIRSTGAAAGWSADQLKEQASAFQQLGTFGDEAIISMQSVLLTFTKIGGQTFPRTTQAVLDLSARMGQDLKASAVQLGKALNDPVANLGELGRAGIQFTKEQKTVIKALWEGGQAAKAQSLILDELERQFGGSDAAAAAAAGGGLKQMKNALGDLGELIGNSMLPALDVSGRAIAKWAGQVQKYAGAIASAWNKSMSQVVTALGKLIEVGSRFTLFGLAFKSEFDGLVDTLDLLAEGLEIKAAEALAKYENVAVESVETTNALADSFTGAADSADDLVDAATKLKELLPDRIEAGGVVNWEDQGDAFTRAMRQGIVNARPMVARVLSDAAESGLTEGSEKAAANARGPWEALFKDVFGKQYWTDVGLMIGDAIADAIINGDTSNLKEQFGQLGREVGGQMGATFGMMVGGPVGAVIGNVLGQVIGQKVGEVVGGFIGDVLQALGLAPDPKRVLGSFAIGPGGFEGVGGTADAQGVGRQMLAEINRIFDALNNAIQGTVDLTQNMEIQVKRNGQAILQIIETATGNVLSEQTFASVQEAMEAGLVQLLSTSILNMPEGPLTAAFQELFGRVAELGTEGLVEAFEKLAGVGQQLSALGDAGDRLRATLAAGLGAFDKLRADIQSLGLSAEVTAGLLAQVTAKERRYNMELRRTALGQLAAWAKELGVNVRIQRKVAILEAKVRAKKLEIELKMLGMWERWGGLVKELRNLSIEAARAIGKAADTVSQFSNAANTFASTAATAGRAANDFASGIDTVKVKGGGGKKKAKRDQFASLIDQLAGTGSSNQSAFDALFESYQDAIAWTKKNKPKVKDAFGKLREAFEEGWARLVDDLKGGLQEFRDGLALQFGQGTPAGFAQAAESNFQQLLEAALGGDVDALAALQAAADQTLTLGAQAYGTSTQAFMDLFAMVTSGLDQALGTDFAAPLDQTVTAIKEQTDVTVTALQQLRDTVQIEANLDRVILGEIRDAMTWKERVVQV